MFCHNTKAFLFCLPKKDVAGAVFFKAALSPVLGSGHKKNRLQLHPKSGGSRRLRLRNTDFRKEGGQVGVGKICKGVVTSKGSKKSALV